MGGTVFVKSKPGQGATFSIVVPFSYSQSAPPSATMMSAMAQLHGRRVGVMVIDPKCAFEPLLHCVG